MQLKKDNSPLMLISLLVISVTVFAVLTFSASDDNYIFIENHQNLTEIDGAYTQEPLSSDPSDPDDGHSVQWVSDGTGSGDAGDVMIKINVGSTVKTITLVDYSA